MTNRYNIDTTTVRFEYKTKDGEPPKSIKLDGVHWHRQGFHAISYEPQTGLVWYKRLTPRNV
jgi:hypothetical protein